MLEANNDRIHGYNPLYNSPENSEPSQYRCFELKKKVDKNEYEPGGFRDNLVPGDYDNSNKFQYKVKDHQGHIVPQKMLLDILRPIAEDVCSYFEEGEPGSETELTLDNLTKYLQAKYKELHFKNVTKYIQKQLMGEGKATEKLFLAKDAESVDGKVGGYFSVIVWNPVNICRAPEDSHRGNYPANDIDDKVRKFLTQKADVQGIPLPETMLKALNDLGTSPDEEKQKKYITSCNDALLEIQSKQMGYYSFDWQQSLNNLNILEPKAQ
ncbi:hypothetical protein [Thalassotalea fusca]